jgi:hypothetical protein
MSILAVGLMAASTSALAGGQRFECDGTGDGDVSVSARFEIDGDRRKFDASYEATPPDGKSAGSFVIVALGDKFLGKFELAANDDPEEGRVDDIIGDLSYDTQFEVGDDPATNFDNALRFPKDEDGLPLLGAQVVTIAGIPCPLAED